MKYLLPALLLLAGCATAKDIVEQALPRYTRQPVSLVESRWGPAHSVVHVEFGVVYIWRVDGCHAEVHAGDSGKTIGLRWRGDNCEELLARL